MKECKCGSRKFLTDILDGYQEITIDEDGEIIDCETTVVRVAPWWLCSECDEKQRGD